MSSSLNTDIQYGLKNVTTLLLMCVYRWHPSRNRLVLLQPRL